MKKLRFLFFGLIFIYSFGFAQEVLEEPATVVDTFAEYNPTNPTPSKEEIGTLYYKQRNLNPDFKNNYKGEKFDYDRVVKEKEYKPPSPPMFSLPTGLFQVLMYIFLGIILLFVIYFIIKNAGEFSFGSDQKKIKFDASEEQEVEDTENIENNNFFQLIQKAKSDKDYRKAIRYYHLWVLQTLSDKKLIRWNKDKTDYDYYKELGETAVKEDFSNNVYVYDYIWYGKFPLNSKEFELAESIFQRTLNQLK